MAKYKHNKKKNSAFLYETLVLELTKSVLNKDLAAKAKITNIIKESFGPRTALYQELKLYHSIYKTDNVHPITAEKILAEVKRSVKQIDKKQLVKEQNALVRRIRKEMSNDVMDNFVPNYKSLATIYQIFNQKAPIKTRVLLENEVIRNMSKPKEALNENKMVPVDNLVFKTFTKNFNEKYSSELLKEQKELLSKFIKSFADNGLELKIYLNEEISRLKTELKESLSLKEISSDSSMVAKTNIILETLNSYKSKQPDKNMVEKIVKIQGLVSEIKSDG
jgi:hypothetical protein